MVPRTNGGREERPWERGCNKTYPTHFSGLEISGIYDHFWRISSSDFNHFDFKTACPGGLWNGNNSKIQQVTVDNNPAGARRI